MKEYKKTITSNWGNIVSVNYIVNPKFLEKYVPYGTELDYYNGDCYISFMAFNYSQTKLYNISVPFHTTFEEMNLRIYIKKKTGPNQYQFGVAFPKLFFPKISLSLYARIIYKEDYSTQKMNYFVENMENNFLLKYGIKNHVWHNIEILAENKVSIPLIGSSDEYFNKHYWGYSKVNKSKSTEYELLRDEWQVHAIKDYNIEVDFKSLFGDEFDFMTNAKPASITLSNGSSVAIKSPGMIIKK